MSSFCNPLYTTQSNIKATEIIINIFHNNKISLSSDKYHSILQNILNHECYDGCYSYIERESTIMDTYYAFMLLKDQKENVAMLKYVNKYLNNTFTKSFDKVESLFFLRLAHFCNVKIDTSILNSYFERQFNIAYSVDYSQNKELILILLKTAKQYKYKTSKEIYKKIIASASLNSKTSYNTETKIIDKCIDYEILLYTKNAVSSSNIKKLVHLFEKSYMSFSEKLYVTQWIVDLLLEYGYTSFNFSDNIKNNIEKDLHESRINEFYSFSKSSLKTFYATYELLKVKKVITN